MGGRGEEGGGGGGGGGARERAVDAESGSSAATTPGRVEDALVAHAAGEVRLRQARFVDREDEVAHGVREGVLVADDVCRAATRRPRRDVPRRWRGWSRKPLSGPSSSRARASFMRSRSKTRLPCAPVDLEAIEVLAAGRSASPSTMELPIAPFSKRSSASAASSTSTGAIPLPSSRGRSGTKVSSRPDTLAISPTRCRARSRECEPMSPSAPEPAFAFSRRQTRGACGSTIQSCR